jgi:hypothetical protein
MTRADDLRAELELAELEDELVAAKDAGGDPDELREIKDKVRAARQAHREARQATVEPTEED